MRRFLAIAAILAAGPALSQDIPESQSCGGLFCDLGIVGHKTAPAAPATPTKPVPAVAPASPEPVVAAEPKRRIVRRKHVAPTAVAVKAVGPESAGSGSAGSGSGMPPSAGALPGLAPVPPTPVAARQARRQPPAPPAAAPPSDEPVIFVSPASQAPVGKDMFQPIYR